MGRYFGKVGYGFDTSEVRGVHKLEFVERELYGDVYSVSRRLVSSQQVIDNIEISNRFSLVADAFALSNFKNIQYIEYMGTKWKVTDVAVEPPRLNLSAGGVFNG